MANESKTWKIYKGDDGSIYIEPVPNKGSCIAKMLGPNREDNARRIVACVNACKGIETNMLEVLPMGFRDHAMTMDRIAELENCLQETLKALKEASTLTDNEGSDYTEEYGPVIEKAESVLIRKGPAGILTANNLPMRFMGFIIKQAEMPPGQIRFESGLPPYNPADLDDF